ncbi:unnamed protein product [Caenorhabditis brenneri]
MVLKGFLDCTADLSENVKWHWQALDERGHEMQLCNSKNKVHPLLEYRVHGLDANKKYAMRIHFDQTEEKRYDAQDGRLKSYLDADVTCAEANRDPQVVWHQQGVQTDMPPKPKGWKVSNEMRRAILKNCGIFPGLSKHILKAGEHKDEFQSLIMLVNSKFPKNQHVNARMASKIISYSKYTLSRKLNKKLFK